MKAKAYTIDGTKVYIIRVPLLTCPYATVIAAKFITGQFYNLYRASCNRVLLKLSSLYKRIRKKSLFAPPCCHIKQDKETMTSNSFSQERRGEGLSSWKFDWISYSISSLPHPTCSVLRTGDADAALYINPTLYIIFFLSILNPSLPPSTLQWSTASSLPSTGRKSISKWLIAFHVQL